jgi:hypothetical protein
MAILKKIKAAAKKVASKVVSTVKSIGSAVGNAIKGGSQSASALQGSYISGSLEKAAAQRSSNISAAQKVVAKSLPAGSKNLVQSVLSGGGGASPSQIAGAKESAQRNVAARSSGGSQNMVSNYDTPSYSSDLYAGSRLSSFDGGSSPASFSASSIGTRSNNIGSAPSATNYQGSAVAGNIAVGANPDTGMMATPSVTGVTGEETGEATEKEEAKTALETYMESLRKPVNEERLYEKAERESGVRDARERMNATQNKINAVTTKMNTDLLRLRGTASEEGVTEAVYGGQQAQVTREATIALLPLQAQLAADQGDLEMAESNLDTLYKIYSKDAQASVDFYNAQAKAIYDDATASEKRKLDELSADKTFKQSLIKDEINNQQSMASQALKDGNTRLYNAMTSIRPPTNVNSPTFEKDWQNYQKDVAEAASKYGKAPAASGGARGVLGTLPVSIQNRVIGLADNLKSTDIVKKYNSTLDSINVVNGIEAKSKNPADHQQIVYAFAKALDPDSAVREGEYATIKKYAQGAISRYGKEISNAIKGTGFLSEAAIENIKATMNNTFNSRRPLYENTVAETRRVINNIAGADVAGELIIDYSGGKSTQSQNVGKNIVTAPDGTLIEIID